MSSNGGDYQDIFDLCVSCLDRPRCTLQPDAVEEEIADNDTCAKVSIIYYGMKLQRIILVYSHTNMFMFANSIHSLLLYCSIREFLYQQCLHP